MFFLYNVQEFGWIPVHLLVHFVVLEILVHFYPISIGLKQTTFWYFSRTRPSPGDYTCNSCDGNYWGVNVGAAMNHCGGDEAEDRFSSCRGYQWTCAVRTLVLGWSHGALWYFRQRFKYTLTTNRCTIVMTLSRHAFEVHNYTTCRQPVCWVYSWLPQLYKNCCWGIKRSLIPRVFPDEL